MDHWVKIVRVEERKIVETYVTNVEFNVELPKDATNDQIVSALERQIEKADWTLKGSDEYAVGYSYEIVAKESFPTTEEEIAESEIEEGL